MICSYCDREAVIKLEYSSESRCKSCFSKLFDGRVRRAVRTSGLLKNNNKIAVALSGGMGSMVTMYVLGRLSKRLHGSEMIAITIDHGINHRSNHGVKRLWKKNLKDVKSLCRGYGIKQYIYSFREEFGVTLDEIMDGYEKMKTPVHVCNYCTVLREDLLKRKAADLGVTVIAVGNTLDDEARSGFMNFIRAGSKMTNEVDPTIGELKNNVKSNVSIPVLKPLKKCPRDEVELYAMLKGIEFRSERCPYKYSCVDGTLEGTVNRLVSSIEKRHPGSMFQILRSMDELNKIYGR